MLTVEQKEMVNNWISNKKTCFDDAFTDIDICSEVFKVCENGGYTGRYVGNYIDELVDGGKLKKCSGCCGTVYWRV